MLELLHSDAFLLFWLQQQGPAFLGFYKVKVNISTYFIPSSPHTSFLAMQGISTYPNSVSLDTCWAVMG